MHQVNLEPFPIDPWASEMQSAMERVSELGLQVLQQHREGNEKAAEIAEEWRLAERLQDEQDALARLFRSVREIMLALEHTRQQMYAGPSQESEAYASMRSSAEVIESRLSQIEQALLTVRHSALDLLLWADRWGHREGSSLPAAYRESYARLIAYAPVFQPRLEAMQDDLLALTRGSESAPQVQHLLSALVRYRGILQSARSFVRSVVEPPMALVFHETDSLRADWQHWDAAERSQLATEINDCCQKLLYDVAGFHAGVENLQPRLPADLDASLYALPVGPLRILFTVDEDPVFDQIMVTLLRVVDAESFGTVCAEVTQTLYRQLSDDGADH